MPGPRDTTTLELQSAGVLRDLSSQFGRSIGLALLEPATAEVREVAFHKGEGIAVHLEKGFQGSLHVAAPGKASAAFMAEATSANEKPLPRGPRLPLRQSAPSIHMVPASSQIEGRVTA